MKRSELKTVKDLVKLILETDPRARNSDSFLYFKVIEMIDSTKKMGVFNIPLGRFLLNMSDWGFPPFETVRRTRQFVQRKHPHLEANKDVQAFRDENEKVYEDFARGAF